MSTTEPNRTELIAKLMRLNPFAGRGHYEALTTEQLQATLRRWDEVSKPKAS